MARRTSHSLLRPAHDYLDREPDDDFGGLQRDLAATGKAMDRRQLLWLAATLGVGARRASTHGMRRQHVIFAKPAVRRRRDRVSVQQDP
jgi:hypothetical protein